MSTKHEPTEPADRLRDDLKDPNAIGGASTVDGDRENDAGLGGSADERAQGRTNE